MTKDIFGVLKMGISVLLFLLNLFATIPTVLNDLKTELYYQALGVLVASLLMLSYVAYFFYSGWTEFKNIDVRKPILLWLGVAATIVAVYLCIISDQIILQVFAGVLVIIGAQEILRLVREPAAQDETIDQNLS